MAFFSFMNMRFHYECEGEGVPVLFLHGLGGDLQQGRTMLADVGSIRRILMDVRGHGETELGPEEHLSFDQFARDATALLSHLGVPRFVAGGFSMGCGIALNLALAPPDRVMGLILIRPAWMNGPYPKNLQEHVMIGNLLRDEPAEQAKRTFLDSAEYRTLRVSAPAVARSLLGQFDVPCTAERGARLIQIPASVPFTQLSDLAGIQVEAMILATDRDPVHPEAMAQELACGIPGSRLEKVVSKNENIDKHFMECRRHIRDFLKRVQENLSGKTI